MHAGQHCDAFAGINCGYKQCREVQRQIHLTAPNGFRHIGHWLHDVLNIGKAFCTQQLLGNILRRDTDARIFDEADSCRFWWCFFGK